MFHSSISRLKNRIALLRSLTACQLKRAVVLAMISIVLPMTMAFGGIALLSDYLRAPTFSFWHSIPLIVICSLTQICYYAKKFKKQDAQKLNNLHVRN